MEREEKKRRLGSSSTSEQLRLLIMGLRLMASQQLFSTQDMICGLTTCWLSHLLITVTCLTVPSALWYILKQHAHRDMDRPLSTQDLLGQQECWLAAFLHIFQIHAVSSTKIP